MKVDFRRLFSIRGGILIVDERFTATLRRKFSVRKHCNAILVMNVAAAYSNFRALVVELSKRDAKRGIPYQRLALRQFTPVEMQVISKSSYKCINDWTDLELITSCGKEGAERRWSFEDAFLAGLIGSMRRFGLKTEAIRAVCELLRRESVETEAMATPVYHVKDV